MSRISSARSHTPTGERRKPSLGTFGQITVDQARKLALDFLASVRGGADPSRERQVSRAAFTAKDLADRFKIASVEAAGAAQHPLPPYSPDFDPIANAFAKLKPLLRASAEQSIEALRTAVGTVIPASTPAECANCFAAAEDQTD